MVRPIISGIKTAFVVAVSAFLIAVVDVVVRAVTGESAPAWLAPWGPLLVPVAGIVKGLIKKWELKLVEAFDEPSP